MAQVALAWSLSKDFINAPIVGTTSLHNLQDLIGQCKGTSHIWNASHLQSRIAGVHVKLSEEEVTSIDEAYVPRAITGHF